MQKNHWCVLESAQSNVKENMGFVSPNFFPLILDGCKQPALVTFSSCFLIHRFPVPNLSLCQDSFVLFATELYLAAASIPYSTTRLPRISSLAPHPRIFSDCCSSKGLHSADRKHQHEQSLKFLWSVRSAHKA